MTTNGKKRRTFGSVRQCPSSGRWQVSYHHLGKVWHPDVTFTTEARADRALARIDAEIQEGRWRDPRLRLYDFRYAAESWLAANPNKAGSTLRRDRSILENHIYPLIGDLPLISITRAEIQSATNRWITEVSPGSVVRQFAVMQAVFSYAVENEWVPKSPATRRKYRHAGGTHLPTSVPIQRYQLSAEEVATIARSAGPRFEPAIWLAAATGWRWGQIFALTVSSIDFSTGTVTCTRGTTTDERGKPTLGKPGSTKAPPQRVTIDPTTLSIMEGFIESNPDLGPNDLLFSNKNGNLVNYSNFRSRVWLPALKQAGLASIRPRIGTHDLRRWNATALNLAGVDVKTIQERLGHSDPRLTINIYVKRTPQGDQMAASAVSAALHGAKPAA
jgi:integrase